MEAAQVDALVSLVLRFYSGNIKLQLVQFVRKVDVSVVSVVKLFSSLCFKAVYLNLRPVCLKNR